MTVKEPIRPNIDIETIENDIQEIMGNNKDCQDLEKVLAKGLFDKNYIKLDGNMLFFEYSEFLGFHSLKEHRMEYVEDFVKKCKSQFSGKWYNKLVNLFKEWKGECTLEQKGRIKALCIDDNLTYTKEYGEELIHNANFDMALPKDFKTRFNNEMTVLSTGELPNDLKEKKDD